MEKQIIFTTKLIEELQKKLDDGYVLTRQEKFFEGDNPLLKRKNLTFNLTEEEQIEYLKCKLGIDIDGGVYFGEDQVLKQSGIEYFAETFCKIKNEVGQINNITLRDYQKDILNLIINERNSIICGARQSGKCVTPTTNIIVNNVNIPIFKIWYNSIINHTIYDRIKYFIYCMIYKLEN